MSPDLDLSSNLKTKTEISDWHPRDLDALVSLLVSPGDGMAGSWL
jgi:hypothetical protein